MGALPKRKTSGFRKRRRRRKLQEQFNKLAQSFKDKILRIKNVKTS